MKTTVGEHIEKSREIICNCSKTKSLRMFLFTTKVYEDVKIEVGKIHRLTGTSALSVPLFFFFFLAPRL